MTWHFTPIPTEMHGKRVIVYAPEFRPQYMVTTGIYRYASGWHAGTYNHPCRVVAWMPMPDPPTQEEIEAGKKVEAVK